MPYIVLSLMDIIHEYGSEVRLHQFVADHGTYNRAWRFCCVHLMAKAEPATKVRQHWNAIALSAQVPDVDIVLGCGDSPCSKLPSPKRPAAGRRHRRRRQLHADMADDMPRHGKSAAAGSTGNGSSTAAHCRGHGRSGSRGQPEVDDFGTLLPKPQCGSIQADSSGADGAAADSSSLSAGTAGSSGQMSSVHSIRRWTGGGGVGGGSGGGMHPAEDSQQRRALAEDSAEPEPPPPPLPMFMYDTRETHADIPFPDFSYWGHEMDRLWGANGMCVRLLVTAHV